jgi:uncharacterized protein (TIGR02466 family)
MDQLRNAQLGNFFSTPVLEHVWADAAQLNLALRASILDQARLCPGEQLSNAGGWHSATGLLEFCGSAGERLVSHMRQMTREATRRLYAEFSEFPPDTLRWSLSAWANVNQAGHSNNMHTHPGATWSGVYYVDHGEESSGAEAAALHLSDPCPPRTNIFFPELLSATVRIRPEPGLMVLFPSYVPHAVPPHRGARPRISIAFNVRKEPFP